MIKPTHKGATAPHRYQEQNDCSVRSIANVKNITYEEAHNLLKSLGRKAGHTVSGHTLAAACLRSGGKLKLFQADYQEQFQVVAKTVKRYLPYLKEGSYVVITPNHSFAVVNGAIIDDRDTDEADTVLCVYGFKQGETE